MCVFLITNDDHVSRCLLVIYVFFDEMLFQFFCLFFNWVICLLIIHLLEFFIYSGYHSWSDMICKYLLCGLSSQFVNGVFWGTKVLNFNEVKFIHFFSSMSHAFGVISNNSLPNPRSGSFFYASFQMFHSFSSYI